SWYPWQWTLDLDRPKPFFHEVVADELSLSRSEYLLTTSPSFRGDGSQYMYLRLTYRDHLPTYRLGAAALDGAIKRLCERYPQLKRVIRLPLGRDEHIITEDHRILEGLPWWEGMKFFDELDPVSVERLPRAPRQAELPLIEPSEMTKDLDGQLRRRYRKGDLEDLERHGLESPRTRNQGQFQMVLLWWLRNALPEDAYRETLKWVWTRHNGQSRTVNAGDRREIERELLAQTAAVFERMVRWNRYPDQPHNWETGVTKADLAWIVQLFPGDIVNQKRLFRLVCYYRPKGHHQWVYIPWWVWQEIASGWEYQEFRAALESRNMLDSIHSYRHIEGHPEMSYSKKFKLYLPATNEDPIQADGRNTDDYYDALRIVFPTVREIVEFTGVSNQRFYQELGRKNEISLLK
ncbi:MAG: hypothetical protein ACREDU_06845, partial [Methylocella sp.]